MYINLFLRLADKELMKYIEYTHEHQNAGRYGKPPPFRDRVRFDAAGAMHDGSEGAVKSCISGGGDVAFPTESSCYV